MSTIGGICPSMVGMQKKKTKFGKPSAALAAIMIGRLESKPAVKDDEAQNSKLKVLIDMESTVLAGKNLEPVGYKFRDDKDGSQLTRWLRSGAIDKFDLFDKSGLNGIIDIFQARPYLVREKEIDKKDFHDFLADISADLRKDVNRVLFFNNFAQGNAIVQAELSKCIDLKRALAEYLHQLLRALDAHLIKKGYTTQREDALIRISQLTKEICSIYQVAIDRLASNLTKDFDRLGKLFLSAHEAYCKANAALKQAKSELQRARTKRSMASVQNPRERLAAVTQDIKHLEQPIDKYQMLVCESMPEFVLEDGALPKPALEFHVKQEKPAYDHVLARSQALAAEKAQLEDIIETDALIVRMAQDVTNGEFAIQRLHSDYQAIERTLEKHLAIFDNFVTGYFTSHISIAELEKMKKLTQVDRSLLFQLMGAKGTPSDIPLFQSAFLVLSHIKEDLLGILQGYVIDCFASKETKGHVWEIEVALWLENYFKTRNIKDKVSRLDIHVQRSGSEFHREFDIVTNQLYIECKNVHWDAYKQQDTDQYGKTIDRTRQFIDQKMIVGDLQQDGRRDIRYLVVSKWGLNPSWSGFFNTKTIGFIDPNTTIKDGVTIDFTNLYAAGTPAMLRTLGAGAVAAVGFI